MFAKKNSVTHGFPKKGSLGGVKSALAAIPNKIDAQHQSLLTASAITSEVAAERGYRTATIQKQLLDLGFNLPQCNVPALVVPVFDVHGEVAFTQIRPDVPRKDDNGKAVKYDTPPGVRMVLDVHPRILNEIPNPAVELYITEGVRKADAAVSKGLCCIALMGVWNWRGTNSHRGKTALPDWECVALNGRQVRLVFDSDAATKKEVQQALARLQAFLESKGAEVTIVALPTGPGGTKVGLDDYFFAGHTVDNLKSLPALELSLLAGGETSYGSSPDGLFYDKVQKGKIASVQLTNFPARIVTELTITDGVDQKRIFSIEATVGGTLSRFNVSSEDFDHVKEWALKYLGAEAVVSAGYAAEDHARAAIQLLSGGVPKVTAYEHTGWTQVDGKWVFLHAGGAIGADLGVDPADDFEDWDVSNLFDGKSLPHAGTKGPILAVKGKNVFVQQIPALANYLLPTPPMGDNLIWAIRSSLNVLDIAPDDFVFPLYATTWRPPLGPVDFGAFAYGKTGNGKSETAALLQQHYGAGMDRKHLPGNWDSTANANQALAFYAKDVLFTVDDWLPRGSQSDVERANRDADRLLRSQGNLAGRGRCNRDGTPREGKPPRGLILSTGEATPDGHSLNARFLALELGEGMMKWEKLTKCQEDARKGRYAEAMSGYLRWLAPQYDGVPTEFRKRKEELRSDFHSAGRHPRTVDIAADLQASFEIFLTFAEESGAITSDEFNELWHRLKNALLNQLQEQDRQQTFHDPVDQYLSLLGTALISGKAYVADTDGSAPKEQPTAWGWGERQIRKESQAEGNEGDVDEPEERTSRWPKGDHVGWVIGDQLYLLPKASLAVVYKLAREAGQNLPLTDRTLGTRLRDKGLLVKRDDNRKKNTVRLNAQGGRPDVLHLSAASVIRPEFHGPYWRESDYDGPPLSDLLA